MNVIRYEVYDSKDRWMGGYSTELDKSFSVKSFDMARINASQCNGRIIAIHSDHSEKQVFPEVK